MSISLPELAGRLDAIEPFRVMAILARARALEAAGRSIIHLEIGEPDFPTPEPVVEAAVAALRRGETHYTPALGLPELRQSIARHYAERHGLDIAPGRIAVTTGASGGLLLAMAALFDPGDEVLLADPGYPCNRHFARLLGAEPKAVPTGPETGFQLTPGLVERHWGPRTRGVLLANPGNPTGTVVSLQALREIRARVRGRGGWLLVDEIYHELVYGRDEPSALALGEDVVVVNSFSKYFLMTGWRLGWLVLPQPLEPAIDKLAQNAFLAPPTPAQHAALAAFAPGVREILDARKAELRARRDYLVPALEALGFRIPAPPAGAFYVYADCSRFAEDSEAFAERLLLEAGVAVTPGTDFGSAGARSYVRIAYTVPEAELREAVRRLEGALA